MADSSPDEQNVLPWLAAAIESLRSAGSWCGRIHVHKLLFVLQSLEKADPPCRFELHHFGPYSFDLDSAFSVAEMMDLVKKEFPREGYGPRYDLTEPGKREAATLRGGAREAIDAGAKWFGKRSSSELELIATCIWVQDREGLRDDAAVVKRVRELKPKYADSDVTTAMGQAKDLRRTLGS